MNALDVSTHSAVGWYGKLPTLGDFASRRLPPEFIEPWDRWLSTGMLALRQAKPEQWLTDYLNSPSWRFLLMPGALPGQAGDQAWAGVLMPSVDRVGRYFPFTAACALPKVPGSHMAMQSLWGWLGRLDRIVGDSMQDDWLVERLEDELVQMVVPIILKIPDVAKPAAVIDAEAYEFWSAGRQGNTWWHTDTAAEGCRSVAMVGLPSGQGLAVLLSGRSV